MYVRTVFLFRSKAAALKSYLNVFQAESSGVKVDKPGVDWDLVSKAVELVLGKDSFLLDGSGGGGTVSKGRTLLALVVRGRNDYTLIVSFRASVQPNTAAMISSALVVAGFRLELDPHFEFDSNGEMVTGSKAVRFFAENAKFILLGERDPSPSAIIVRPKGPYTKHHFN
jgi:hypothetical protein